MGKAGFTVETTRNRYGRYTAAVTIPNVAVFGPQVARAARRAIVADLTARELCAENVGVRFVKLAGAVAYYEEVELEK